MKNKVFTISESLDDRKMIDSYDCKVLSIIQYKNSIVVCTENGVYCYRHRTMTWLEIWKEIVRKFR